MVPDPDGTLLTWTVGFGTLPFNPTAGVNSGGAWQVVGTGGPCGTNYVYSRVINVIPGEQYWFSGWIDASHVSSGNPNWLLYDPAITTQYLAVNQTPGVNGRVSALWTCPIGVTKVVAIADTQNCTVANGQKLSLSNPMLEPGIFHATKYGKWARGPITSSAGFDLTPGNVSIKFTDNTADQGGPVLFPATNVTMLQAVAGKLFLPAGVAIYTAYMPTYGDTSLGLGTKFIGDIIKMEGITRNGITFTAYDLTWRFDQNCPPNLYQPGCRHTLFNPNCMLNVASFQQSATVAGGSSQSLINTTSALPAVGSTALPYGLGVITWLTGNNAGLSSYVRTQNSSTQLQLDIPTFLPVNTGDTFVIIPGCDKTFATCLNTYANTINFGGERFMPPGEVAL